MKEIKLSYDESVDAAYIQLTGDISNGSVAHTVGVDDENMDDINLDFDKSGRLLGVEILSASKILSADFFEILRGDK